MLVSFKKVRNGVTLLDSNSPLFGDVLALSYPGALEVVAKLVPKHKNVTRGHFFLPGLWLHPKVAHRVLETAGEKQNRGTNSVVLSHINTYKYSQT